MFESKALFANLMYFPFMGLLVYLELDKESIQILCYLLVIDYVIGIIKSIRFNFFDYQRMISGIVAKSLILLVPITLAFMFKGIKLFDLFGGYVNTVISLLIIAETISILINIASIKTGENIDKPDFINIIVFKLRVFLEKLFIIFK